MKIFWTAGALSCALLIGVPGPARASNEFENGFKTELGAISARTAVGIVFDGILGGGRGNSSFQGDRYLNSDYRVRMGNQGSSSSRNNAGNRYPSAHRDEFRGRPEPQRVYVARPAAAPEYSSPVVCESSSGVAFVNATLFRVNVLGADLQNVGASTISWQELQGILVHANDWRASSGTVVSTEGIAFSSSTQFQVRSLLGDLRNVGVDNVAWQDLRKILARNMN